MLGTSVKNVKAIAESMGLGPAVKLPPQQSQRGFFWMTMCRRNWHVSSADQLAALLDASCEKLANYLRVEDHGLWYVLGNAKPALEDLAYAEPIGAARRRAGEIKAIVKRHFGDEIHKPDEPRFAFVDRLSRPKTDLPRHRAKGQSQLSPRIICSYLKLFGDPLLDEKLGIYPEGMLQRYAQMEIDGIWLYGVLRQLAPGGEHFPEFGDRHEQRLANLRTLVQRAGRYGIGVYLYLNEPRAMEPAFFENHREIAGAVQGDRQSMCTTTKPVRRWMEDALTHVFTQVPELAGVFLITSSENPTNCWSHHRATTCPRCNKLIEAEVLARVVATIERGVHRANPKAKVIAWDWGWAGHGRSPRPSGCFPGMSGSCRSASGSCRSNAVV